MNLFKLDLALIFKRSSRRAKLLKLLYKACKRFLVGSGGDQTTARLLTSCEIGDCLQPKNRILSTEADQTAYNK